MSILDIPLPKMSRLVEFKTRRIDKYGLNSQEEYEVTIIYLDELDYPEILVRRVYSMDDVQELFEKVYKSIKSYENNNSKENFYTT